MLKQTINYGVGQIKEITIIKTLGALGFSNKIWISIILLVI
jgi:hypothetical protein